MYFFFQVALSGVATGAITYNLWVTLAAGSFTIHASAAPTSTLAIAYLIIN